MQIFLISLLVFFAGCESTKQLNKVDIEEELAHELKIVISTTEVETAREEYNKVVDKYPEVREARAEVKRTHAVHWKARKEYERVQAKYSEVREVIEEAKKVEATLRKAGDKYKRVKTKYPKIREALAEIKKVRVALKKARDRYERVQDKYPESREAKVRKIEKAQHAWIKWQMIEYERVQYKYPEVRESKGGISQDSNCLYGKRVKNEMREFRINILKLRKARVAVNNSI